MTQKQEVEETSGHEDHNYGLGSGRRRIQQKQEERRRILDGVSHLLDIEKENRSEFLVIDFCVDFDMEMSASLNYGSVIENKGFILSKNIQNASITNKYYRYHSSNLGKLTYGQSKDTNQSQILLPQTLNQTQTPKMTPKSSIIPSNTQPMLQIPNPPSNPPPNLPKTLQLHTRTHSLQIYHSKSLSLTPTNPHN